MDSAPEVLLCLDQPTTHPTFGPFTVAGWVASPTPIESVCVIRPDGSRSAPLGFVERPDVRLANPRHAHVTGFNDLLPLTWVPAGRIEIVGVVAGKEYRLVRELAHTLDIAVKAKKLNRIAPLLRTDLPGSRQLYHFDFLSAELRESYRIEETAAVSSNGYDGIALDLIARHAYGLILDAGAGLRKDYLPNVVNFEIAPYPSTDVLGVGEELPFRDNVFDAVVSLNVLEHVKDPFKCARELTRVLKPGGTLYAAVPFLQHYHGYPRHYYNMTHQGLANLFAGPLEIKEQRVLASGYPIWTLCWFLQIYSANLPPAERAKFQEMKISDFLGEPGTMLEKDFVKKLSEDANFKLASTTVLLAQKPVVAQWPSPAPPTTHEEKTARWLRPFSAGKKTGPDFGVEIGAFKSPVPGIRPFYVDRFETYADEACLADYWGDGTELPFHDHSLDYVVTSHVLEHMANPVAAIWEWARVTRHGGILYLVVPDRRFTFDHLRELTAPEHMLEDYKRGTTYADGTHIGDYLDGLDWSRRNPAGTAAQNAATREELRTAYEAAVAAGLGINIHFHVFEPTNLDALIALMNRQPERPCELVPEDRAEQFPSGRGDGMLLVLRVNKPWRARLAGWLRRRRAGTDARRVLLSTAKPMPGGDDVSPVKV